MVKSAMAADIELRLLRDDEIAAMPSGPMRPGRGSAPMRSTTVAWAGPTAPT